MGFQPGANLNTVAFGNRPEGVEVPHIDTRSPGLTDINYPIGKTWVNRAAGTYYVLSSFTSANAATSANWALLGSNSGALDSFTTQDSTVVTPTAGTILLQGNGGQGVSTSGSNSPGTTVITVADWTTSQKGVGVLATGAQAIAGSGTTQAVTPSALQSKIGTQTAHGVALGNTGATSALSWTAAGATGTVLAGSTGADPAFTGSPSVSGSLTAATTITATSGAITATNGNFVGSASGTGLLLNSPTATGAASGPVICNGRSGSVIFTTVSIAAAADLTLTITNSSVTASTTQVLYSLQGATTGSALSIKSVTNSSGSSAIVVTNGTGATTTTANITLVFLVLNT